MSQDNILIDIQAVKYRYELFRGAFPMETVGSLFEFTVGDNVEANLEKLSNAALNERYSLKYLFTYKPLILEVISRWINGTSDKETTAAIFDVIARYLVSYPLAKPLVEIFLDRENDYLTTIVQNPSSHDIELLRMILLAYYRVLNSDKDAFARFIKPDALYKVIDKASSDVVKFLAIKIIALYLDTGEVSFEVMVDNHIDSPHSILGFYELQSDVNYRYLELNEAKLASSFTRLPEVPEVFTIEAGNQYYVIEPQQLSSNVVSIGGVLVPRVRNVEDQGKKQSEIVPTEKSVSTLRNLAKGLQKSHPMLLLGKAGSGKTFLINELSKYMGCSDSIVKIHLGEQTDAKLLIGTYTSGERPGTFEWRSGVLTTAVREGRWVLIEDVDKAPTEVLSILLTLLEKRELNIPSRGETVKAANGFQLISTVRIDERSQRRNKEGAYPLNILGMRMWSITELEEPDEFDLTKILTQKYPILKNLIPHLIRCYRSVKEIYLDPGFTSLNKGAHTRIISVRDLVKLCSRLQTLFSKNHIFKPDQLIESHVYDDMFSEAADCFTAAISAPRALNPLVNSIGESLEISKSRIELYLKKHVPKFEDHEETIEIGRSILPKARISLQKKSANTTSFATTNHSLRLMEQISVSIQMDEPVLLVGETGTGKTTVVQQLGKLLHRPLTVINVSQQTETGDLLGGYKPVNSKTIALPVQESFESLFSLTFSLRKNERFYKMLHRCFNKGQWKNVVKLWKEACKMAESILNSSKPEEESGDGETKKKKRKLNIHDRQLLLNKWLEFKDVVRSYEAQSESLDSSFVFNFVEGSLVKAVRNGDWLLLDEINLASADTLESISDLLSETATRSILLSEKGDVKPIKAHPDFRIFACMNPATDVGKRDLPSGIRSRFTEIYVQSPDRDISDLLLIIDRYMRKFTAGDEWVGNDIAELYLEAKKLAEANMIVDGSNQKPHFSIRTLTRTLLYVCDIVHIYGLRRSLYDGFCMSFLNLLSKSSESLLEPIIQKYTLARLKNMKSVMSQAPPCPGPDYVQFNHYWMKKGYEEITEQPHYIITPFVERNMMNLVRATSGRRFPVLIQGPTSAGKTSMIKYLADLTGHKFVRINNHEHTDLQEYLGTYIADDTGKLSFKEGVLVEALRKGYWIVLDELNLAPTDVLEALNRLLDDNRELFIPETQEVVHPHPDFMLFATQNPPGIYGGRKILSRAFRNRFLELHFDDIPQDELEVILRERCQIAPSYAKKIVESYRQLSVERSATRLFEQKNSFATLRDLFRWAFRDAVGYDELAANGYMLLAERCRNTQEKETVKRVLEKVMRVKLNMDHFYEGLENKSLMNSESTIVWTQTMRRLLVLVSSCLKNNEPILLVGETGCGKTTICQLIASHMKRQLVTLNAHQNTETGDILGAQRPVRNRSQLQTELFDALCKALNIAAYDAAKMTLQDLLHEFDRSPPPQLEDSDGETIKNLRENLNILFEWTDGPLVKALKDGNFFLFDEISLADDSVLERLNSVLEPERSLLLAEKGSTDSFITAADGFQFFATMNPGGDYGKKELSPALRNRFTEIWVPSMENFDDVYMVVSSKLIGALKFFSKTIVSFSEWFAKKFGGGSTTNGVISLRDILAWVEFMNNASSSMDDANALLIHGASMVFIDALGTNNTAYLAENEVNLRNLKIECIKKLSALSQYDLEIYCTENTPITQGNQFLEVGIFKLPVINDRMTVPSFNWNTPTTSTNLMRVTRALQLKKPILLEGSPGVGKTSLVTALAESTGHKLTRINLSEQTDLIDLFGSDVPGEKTGEFVWRDAPFLRAMQRGEWVLLDEMNLASQSVLEGLNACLDHRGETYIPELDKTFVRHPNFVVFAAQNPQYQGGGRKGLPKSFVNRFNVVYVSMLTANDLQLIANQSFPQIEPSVSAKIIQVMSTLEDQVCKRKSWGTLGSPWEFNLRDTLRWMRLLDNKSVLGSSNILDFLDMIVKQRFRSEQDRDHAQAIIRDIFGNFDDREPLFKIEKDYIQINGEIIKRNPSYSHPVGDNLFLLECNIGIYETAIRSINNNWPLLLVGPTNSGKTEIVRFLASTVGAKVTTFSMNSEIDSMDILGGYEQVDITRKISNITNSLLLYLKKTLLVNLGFHVQNESAIASGLILYNFISNTAVGKGNFYEFVEKFETFLEYFQMKEELKEITEKVKSLNDVLNEDFSVKFEWFDGTLVRAIEEGHWLILDNANLCPASVLDRLNSLLETNGSLVMNECNQDDGQPRVLIPNKDFRLFLTVNPKYGELSRAMRNRAVEVYVEDLNTRASKFDSLNLGYKSDLKQCSSTQKEINSDFSTLSLSEMQKSVPLRHYLPAYLSSMKYIGDIFDIISLSDEFPVAESLLGVIPLERLKEVEYWSSNLYHNESPNEIQSGNTIKNLYEFLIRTNVVNRVAEAYHPFLDGFSQICDNKFQNLGDQTLIPSLNPYLVSKIAENKSSLASAEPIYLLTLVRILSQCVSSLQKIETRSIGGKINELTYIELSAAMDMGRNIKQPPRIPIFSLLNKLALEVFESVKNNTLFSTANQYELFIEFIVVWIGALETSSSRDEARLTVYKDLFENWYIMASEKGLDVKSFSDVHLAFNSAVVLTRGKSITPIWNSYRAEYPSNAECWVLWDELSLLSKKFDAIVELQYSESYEEVKVLREFFVTLFGDILQKNVKEFRAVTSKLESGIDDLKSISDKFLVKRKHFFMDEFDNIMRFWFNGDQESLQAVIHLSSVSSISTKNIVQLQGKRYSYPPVFDLLWTKKNGDVQCFTESLVSSRLVEEIVLKSKMLKTFPGSHIRQTIVDAKLLLESTLKFPRKILANQIGLFADKLHDWVINITQIHLKSEIRNIEVAELTKIVFEEATDNFSTVFKEYLLPALQSANCKSLEEEVGRGYVLFGIGLIFLYAPDSPYDPAIHDYVMYENFLKQREFSKKLKDSFAVLRLVVSGDEQMKTEKLLNDAPEAQAPQKPRVYRPASTVDDLFEEWTAFINSTASPGQLFDLLESLKEWNEPCANRILMFQQSTTQFLERITTGYKYYSDLNEVFAGYVFSMKLGFDLIRFKKSTENRTIESSSLWPVDPLLVVNSSEISEVFEDMTKIFRKSTIENLSVENILVFFLKLFKFHGNPKNMASMFNDILQTLYYRYSLRRLKVESDQQEESKTFKYKDSEENYEIEFADMFPDYEDVLSLTNAEPSSSNDSIEEVSYMVAKAYMEVFSELKGNNVNEIINSGSEVVKLLIDHKHSFRSQQLNDKSLSAAVNILAEEIQAFEKPLGSNEIDFYKGSSIQESQKAVIVIETLCHFIFDLLSQWPEHATLIELFRICQEFLQYSAITPIAKQLQKIEQIYTFMAEWEKYASSKVSLQVYIKSVTDLIISWRKLELQTWNRLLQSEDEKQNAKVGQWWYHLFETIIASNASPTGHQPDQIGNSSLVSSLNLYLGKCTVGEFSSRLELLKAFSSHLSYSKYPNTRMSAVIHNVISYYEQFRPFVDSYLIEGRKKIEKDISEVILLASWKDVNVDALKQSSRRSHASLYKQVRKYRSLLTTNVFSIIESGIPLTEKVSSVASSIRKPSYHTLDLSSAKVLVLEIPDWSSRPPPLQNIDAVNDKMKACAQKMSETQFPDFTELVKEFCTQAENLKRLTPKIYKKDDKNLTSLKMQKNKALNDSLKELKRIGLKSNFRQDIHKVQHSSTAILSNTASFSDTPLRGCDAYFFRIVDMLPRLRNAIFSPSEDVPISSLEKGMAIMENLIFSLISTREPMHTLGNNYTKFADLRMELENISRYQGDIKHHSLNLNKNKMINICKWLPALLDYAISTIQITGSGPKVRDEILLLQRLKIETEDFEKLVTENTVWNSSIEDSFENFRIFMNKLVQQLQQQKNESNFFIYDILLSWLNDQSLETEAEIEQTSLKGLEHIFRKLFTSLLLSFQKLLVADFEPVVETEDKWLSTTSRGIMNSISFLRTPAIIKNMHSAVEFLKENSFLAKHSVLARSLVTFTLPILNHYQSAMYSTLMNSKVFYQNLAHGTHILSILLHNLAKDGFCSPTPPSEEVDDKNLQEGTGLGDGEGAENNSKDIEQDEDLTEDAQKPNEDQKEEDEGEEDAVAMEGDMAGELENVSDQEENDEEDNDEDQDEMEEEIDDLDDDDPNAIDDKMWDGKPDEEAKEKDTEKNLDNKSDETDVQAGGDNDEKNDNQEVANEEQSNEDQEKVDENDQQQKNDESTDDEGDGEDNVGEQEDEVREDENAALAPEVPDVETMDLPDEMNLDSGSDNEQDQSMSDSDEFHDNLDDLDEDIDEPKELSENEADIDPHEQHPEEEDVEMEEDGDADESNSQNDEDANSKDDPDLMEENDSEGDLQQNEVKEEDQTEEGGEENVEGVDGVESKVEDENIDQDAAVQQQSGTKGKGSDSKDSEEQQDIGSSGATANDHQDRDENAKENETSRDNAKETLKQLGDALKDYHKRRQDINEASQKETEEEVEENANQRPDEFEHIEGDNTQSETQALGTAKEDQTQTIDEQKAIEDDLERNESNDDSDVEMIKDEEIRDDQDLAENVANEENNSNEVQDNKAKGAFIGEKKDNIDGTIPLNDKSLSEGRDDELEELMEIADVETQADYENAVPPRSLEESRILWNESELATTELSARLSEQLRLILEPTLATKLKGDYKTGKRLNMKRIIPYIASQFRKDKIWLRRTKPSKRQYQIMIALDDSKSMSESKCVKLAFESLCLVSKTLTQLESGGLSIVKFGEKIREVHKFDEQFSNEAGVKSFQWFGFQETRTDIKMLVAESIRIFERARAMNSGDQWQLQIVISDGVCEDHETIERLVRRARESKIMLVFVIIDGINSSESIMDMSQVKYVPDDHGNMNLKINKYLDTFPFEFYVVVRDITELPEMLSVILRQFFADLASV